MSASLRCLAFIALFDLLTYVRAESECTGRYANVTSGDGTMIDLYGQCVVDSGEGTQQQYWVKYQCVDGGNVSTLVKYVYAINDACLETETDIIDIDPEIITEWCCSKIVPQILLPSPETDVPTTTSSPSKNPPNRPRNSPTKAPSPSPSSTPSRPPSNNPTTPPATVAPTRNPTAIPTDNPTVNPTNLPTISPTRQPTMIPTTWSPTRTGETRPPTHLPTAAPTKIPTHSPTNLPSAPPTSGPTVTPTKYPSNSPTQSPTAPTITPTNLPTLLPTITPSSTSTVIIIINAESDDQDSDENTDQSTVNANDAAQSHQYPLRAQAVPGMPVHVVCLLAVVMIFVALIYNFIKKSKTSKKDIRWSLKIPVIISFAGHVFAMCSIIAVSAMMIAAEEWDVETYETVLLPYNLVGVGYVVGKMGVQTFFILRAYQGFQKSAFVVSKCTLAVLLTSMLIIALSWVYLLLDIDVFKHEWSGDFYYVVLSAIDTVFMACLLLLFTNKLMGLVMLHRSQCMSDLSVMIEMHEKTQASTQKSDESATSGASASLPVPKHNNKLSAAGLGASIARPSTTQTSADLGEFSGDAVVNVGGSSTLVDAVKNNLAASQTRWISVITRCILLNCIAFCTTILFGFLSFYYLRNAAPLYVLYSSWSLDMLINSVCLYLNFAFASTLYNRCCVCCHGQCQRLMEYCAARQMVRDHTASKKAEQKK